jgi:hypothetical protein
MSMLTFRLTLLISALLLVAGSVQAQLYDVTTGLTTYEKRDHPAVTVQVDGSVENTRDFWQQYMKETYDLRFKGGALASLGVGKKDVLSAQQVSGIRVSSRPVDLYVNFAAANDSVTTVALFGGFGDKTFFEPTRTVPEFKGLQNIMQKFAVAARVNAYRDQVKQAENNVAAAEKEQQKLTKSIQSAQSNTASNLKRIDELTRQNVANAQQMHNDSTQLTTNALLRETTRLRLQQRRDRLATVERK